MNIQKRLDSLAPYVVGIRYAKSFPIIDVVLKEGWSVPNSDIIQIEKVDNEELNYYMFFSQKDGVGVDELLNYAEGVILFNIEREKKHELLKIKAKELQELFKNNSLDKLNKLKFVLDDDKLINDLVNAESMKNITLDIDKKIELAKTKKPVEDIKNKPEQAIKSKYINSNNDGEINEQFEHIDLDKEPIKKNVNGRTVELPNRKPKVELQDFSPPTNIVCKCGANEICPACEESKGY